jgi:hypothetical protein
MRRKASTGRLRVQVDHNQLGVFARHFRKQGIGHGTVQAKMTETE